MFAIDPKRPGQVNATPMTINTGDAQPRAFPNVIGSPFRLTRKGAIPRQNLVEASHDNKTIWSLPRRDIVLFSAVTGQK